MKNYPKCFPENFATEILPDNAKLENKTVYRIIKSGKIDRDGFLSTFEEIKNGSIPPGRKIKNLQDPSLYSTSCNMDYSEAKHLLEIFMRHNPTPIIAIGETEKTCGPCQLTSDRIPDRTDSHVDWWIFDDSAPQLYFREVKDNE